LLTGGDLRENSKRAPQTRRRLAANLKVAGGEGGTAYADAWKRCMFSLCSVKASSLDHHDPLLASPMKRMTIKFDCYPPRHARRELAVSEVGCRFRGIRRVLHNDVWERYL